MKKTILFVISVIMILVFAGCSDSSNSSGSRQSGSGLKISTVYSKGSNSKSIAIPEYYDLTTDANYNSLLRDKIRSGEYLDKATPSFIFLGLNNLEFFNTEDNQENIFNTNGDSARVHNDHSVIINMFSTKGLSSYDSELSKLNKAWHHLAMVFTAPWVGKQTSVAPDPYNDPFSMSIVGVKVPEGIDKNKIKNTVQVMKGLSDKEKAYLSELLYQINGDDYVWFQFMDLVPFEFHYPAAVVFSDTLEKTQIFYKNAGVEVTSHYCIGNGNPEDSSNMSIIEIPVETMDFSGITNPEVEISYFAENLIYFYKVEDEYYAYFNPSNPFPISVTVKEAQPENTDYVLDESQVTSTDIEEAVPYFCTFNRFINDNFITLQFSMPNYPGITGVEIYHSTENNFASAQLIFSGSACIYRHRVSDVMGDHFYWIRSVAADGSKSDLIAFREGFKEDKSQVN